MRRTPFLRRERPDRADAAVIGPPRSPNARLVRFAGERRTICVLGKILMTGFDRALQPDLFTAAEHVSLDAEIRGRLFYGLAHLRLAFMSTSTRTVLSMSDIVSPAGLRSGATVLVTGAAGNLGREVVASLQARGANIRRLVRRASDFDHGPRTETATGDLTDGVAVRAALVGIEAVVLMWPLLNTAPSAALIAELAEAAPRVVYLSSTAINDDARLQSDPITQTHADMEALLRDAGLRPVVLRSDTLASNVRGWAAQLRAGDVVAGPDYSRTAVVDERDVADATAAAVLANPTRLDHGPRLLTGPELLSRADLVARLGSALGRRLRFEAVPVEVARARMLDDGRPATLVDALLASSVHRPESTLVTDHVERLTGRPAGTFARWAVDHAAEFR